MNDKNILIVVVVVVVNNNDDDNNNNNNDDDDNNKIIIIKITVIIVIIIMFISSECFLPYPRPCGCSLDRLGLTFGPEGLVFLYQPVHHLSKHISSVGFLKLALFYINLSIRGDYYLHRLNRSS